MYVPAAPSCRYWQSPWKYGQGRASVTVFVLAGTKRIVRACILPQIFSADVDWR